jgi:cytochrome b subunit of formate dehydrogenase/nitrate/TMAO reductase-like tetraheme cytochrome c subunit
VCSDCHSAHGIKKNGDPDSTVSNKNAPNTCSKCHEDIFKDFEASAHGAIWKNGDGRGPVCTTCHTAHEIKQTGAKAFQLQIPTQCGKCHEKEAPTYRDTFHGQASSLGFIQAARCSDCHTPHRNLPKDDPHSSVHSSNLLQTCGKCHAGINEKFVSFDPHPEPSNRERSVLIFSAHTFMKWLFIVVFGFFGLHTLLWFQRSIVAVIRKETHRITDGGKWIMRFAMPHRITHIVMVISFLGLAATGLPLMYHYTGWGKTLGAVMGGVEVSRYFHRLWAIVTFGYAFYHLGYLLYHRFSRRDLSLLKGPDSLVARGKDFRELLGMFRWFFYAGPQPKLDRWTYWEKFDYYAVFWGIPVIGLSGLVLWLPGLFTKILPGEWLNVAMIVHGEEALLAVGFIFAFHFFHNHMRPENFPLDTVIFTGRMPMEKFIKERPAEYERLEREGRLESLIVEPPSKLVQAFSAWFGYAALTVGVILVIAIFVTFLFRS